MKGKMNKRLIAAVTVGGMLLILVLIAIGVLKEETQGERKYHIILIPKTIDEKNNFWSALIEGAELGAEEFGVEIQVLGGTTEEDYAAQNRLIEQSIEERPDAILIAPCSFIYTTEAIQKAVNEGIPVVLIDSVVDQNIAQSIVATDNFEAGKELGEFTKSILDSESQIGVISYVKGSSTAAEREKGLRAGLGEYEERIYDIVYCNSSYQRASELTEQMLKANPEVNVLIGTNEYSSVGAARKVKEMGLSGKVKVIGFDNSVEEIQLLEEGVFKGILIQKPFNIGYLGMEQAVRVVKGLPVERELDSGCKMITKMNMYEEENQRLLYPFSGQQ